MTGLAATGAAREDVAAEGIAVVGVGCRLPGGISGLDGLWSALSEGRDLVSELPIDRFATERFVDPARRRRGKCYTSAAGVLTGFNLAEFDAKFFGVSPREASRMDPQQRLLLEMSVEAFDDAGIDPAGLTGSDTSVFVGISEVGYSFFQNANLSSVNAYTNSGCAASIAANRLSYFFDFHGPSMAIDTACSSSLVAVHQACRSLVDGTCRVALAAGVNVLLNPYSFVGFARASMLSPSGRCRPFSANADGYVRAEGGGVVVLKRLSDAVADGDRVHGVILGSGTNCDGRTRGLALPGARTQEALLRQVYAAAGVEPDEVGYFEAHGTGTPVGDPIECAAIGGALGRHRRKGQLLPVGSVKSNLGHLEPAAGMAGLLKALVVLRHHTVPPTLHVTPPNPEIDFTGWGLAPAVEAGPLSTDGRGVVGVNSFGFGGANAHVIVGAGPAPRPNGAPPAAMRLPVVVSARSPEALTVAAERMAEHLADATPVGFTDIAYTAARRRGHHPHRAVVLAGDGREAADRLRRVLDQPAAAVGRGRATARGRVAFVFSGNGAQWAGMGADLLATDAVFRSAVAAVDARLRPRLGWSVAAELAANAHDRMRRTEVAQPALFAVQVGVADLLRSWGVIPAVTVGHSAGEVAAAYVAGALDLDAACQVVAERSRAQAVTAGSGRMAAVGLPVDRAREVLARWPGLELAAINTGQDVTISGDAGELAALGEHLMAQGVFFRELDLDYPFHSRAMDPIVAPLRTVLADLAPTASRLPMASTVTGRWVSGAELDGDYWGRNVREPVLFGPAVQCLLGDGVDVFVEVGPHPVLGGYLRRLAGTVPELTAVVDTLTRTIGGAQALEATMAALIAAGVPVDWDRYFPKPGRVVELPPYPWQRERHWNGTPHSLLSAGGDGTIDHPLLGERMAVLEPTWQDVVEPVRVPWLADHRVGGAVVLPAAAYVEMALAAGRRVHDAPVEVTDLRITSALVLHRDDGQDVRLQFSLSEEDDVFRVASRTEDGAEWHVHATGRVRRLWRPQPLPAGPRDPGPPLPRRLSKKDFYGGAAEAGLDYGPAFQVLDELRVGEDHVLASYVHEASQTGYEVHPALLDATLQAGAPLLDSAAEGKAFLPVSIGTVRCWRQPAARGMVRVRSRARTERYARWDITVLDDQGIVALELRDVWLRRFDALDAPPVQRYVTVLRAAPYESGELAPAPVPAVDELLATPQGESARAVLEHVDSEVLRWTRQGCAHYAAAALAEFVPLGQEFDQDDLLAAGLSAKFAGLAELLLSAAQAQGFAHRTGDRRWRLTSAGDPSSVVRSLIEECPQHGPETALFGQVGNQLAGILRGQRDPGEMITVDCAALVERYHEVAPLGRATTLAILRLLSAVVNGWPEDHPLRVLEVGAGTGATSAALLPVLPPERTRYVVTDTSRALFPRARKRLERYDFVDFAVLDLDRDPADQGFPDATFDVIVASNTLHGTVDLERSVRSVSRLLTDGGLLLAGETHDPELVVLPFGVLDGFWRAADRDLRPTSGLLPRAAWPALLRRCGFGDVVQLGDEREPLRGAASVLVAARERRRPVEPVLPPTPLGTRWIVLAEDDTEVEFGAALAERLTDAGADEVRVAVPGAAPDGWPAVLDPDAASVRIVFLLSAGPALPGGTGRVVPDRLGRRAAILRDLAVAGDRLPDTSDTECWVVTRPSGALPAPERPEAPEDAAIWGAARSLANECPALGVRRLSLARVSDLGENADRLARELLTPSDEDEIVLTGGGRFVPRVVEAEPETAMVAVGETTPCSLQLHNPGLSYRLSWVPRSRPVVGPGEVAIAPRATALNYRDVLNAVGVLPPEAVHGTVSEAGLGFECAGVVTEVGAGVTELAPGDRVFGMAPAALGSPVVADARAVARIPDGLSFTEASTLPVAAITVHHGLGTLARLAPGEVLLVHGGAGGVGLAALQYARHRGATVIATAGSAAKRNLLRTLGVEHVFASRDLSFVDDVLRATGGRGVDVVLNSLAGEAAVRSLELLCPHGRFVELGKRDILENKRLSLRPLERNISLFCVDLSTGEPDHPLSNSPMSVVAELVAEDVFRPLPHTVYPAARVAEAVEFLRHSRHIGKVVVSFEADVPVELRPAPVRLDPSASYLVTGGLGGFGAATARWLAARGARNLALVSRRGPDAPEASGLVAELAAQGVTATAYAADVADVAAMRRVFDGVAATGCPLRGVVHAAMRLDDAPLGELTDDRFRTALVPKLRGAQVLDELTADKSLDFFLLFSSVSALVGQIGQGNYCAGNLATEALARNRRWRGLPGQAVEWGVLGEVGYAARTGMVDTLTSFGLDTLAPREVLAELERFLGTDLDVLTAGRMDWGRLRDALPALRAPRLARLLPPCDEGTGQDHADFAALLAEVGPEEAHVRVRQALVELLAGVLQIEADRIEPSSRLDQLGMDSLMGAELLVSIRARLGCDVPVMAAVRSRNVDDLARIVLARLVPGAADQDGEPRG
ncbi:Acyl transferase domain-containing protein [Amycolatopsis arida]|uniref:Acyl transferase domain-containing protein n=1 Tax=Amycolatopsis arida TaxID=587909 RepID=A0A1I5UXS7_9PSEU|nr:type I polyketide synthase [Amycolatopsis arida]TDX91072.1 acyl transferase domain-containing protein [Amycolatopsis arida]SFQ00002.1 Acyl transferase domain-containing protein [Amycolatopsis arida]